MDLPWREYVSRFLRLFRPGWPFHAVTEVEIGSIPTATRQQWPRSRIVLRLAPTLCLHRHLALPRAARSEAAQTIDLKLRASLPHAGAGLVWAHHLTSSEGAQDRYDVWLVKSATLNALLEEVRAGGARPVRVDVAGTTGTSLWVDTPVSKQTVKTWAMASFLVVLGFALGHIFLVETQRQDLDATLQSRLGRIAALETRLASARASEAQAGARNAALQAQIASFQDRSRPLVVLQRLGRDLPGDVWLSELSLSSEGLRVSGFSKSDASTLLQEVQALDWVRDVRLESPIVQDSFSGDYRFDLILRLHPVRGLP